MRARATFLPPRACSVFRSAVAGLLVAARPALDAGMIRARQSAHIRCATDRLPAASALLSATPMRRSLERLAEAARAAGASGLRDRARASAVGDRADARNGSHFRRRRRTARLHRARRRSAPACRRLRRRADLRLGAYRRARHGAAHRRDRRAATRAVTIHISGCAKGCAHAAPAALTIVGTAEGCALIANGSARDAPFAVVAGG